MKKTQKANQSSTHFEMILMPITDPVEQAELDRRRDAAEKVIAEAERKVAKAMADAARKAEKRKSSKRK